MYASTLLPSAEGLPSHTFVRKVSFEEMLVIAETLGVCYEQAFIFPDGRKISLDTEGGEEDVALQ